MSESDDHTVALVAMSITVLVIGMVRLIMSAWKRWQDDDRDE